MFSTSSNVILTKNILISLCTKSVCTSRMKGITSRNERLAKEHGPVDGKTDFTGNSWFLSKKMEENENEFH